MTKKRKGSVTSTVYYETHTEVTTWKNGKKTVKIHKPPLPIDQTVSIIFRGISRNPSKDDSEKPKEEPEVREKRKKQPDAGGEK